MTITFKKLTLAAAITCALPFAAAANTITLGKTTSSIFGPNGLYEAVQIGGTNLNTINVAAGGFHVTSSTNASFIAWCIDLAEGLKLPFDYIQSPTPFSTTVTDNLSRLFTGYVEDIDTTLEAAAFQVSIWELISDTDGDLLTGEFQLLSNNAVRDKADGFLTGLSMFETDYDLSFFLATGSQDLITGTPSPVPLPATGMMLLAGLGALSFVKCKRA